MMDANIESKSPSKFLDPYTKDEIDHFFGRDFETEELYERLNEGSLVLLYGSSGTGKSSLLQCGLANRFDSKEWVPIWIRRDKHAIWEDLKNPMLASLSHQLKIALKQEIAKRGRPFSSQTDNLIELIEQIYLVSFKPIYLIFDQFEELFIEDGLESQKEFFEVIADLLSHNIPCKILLSIQEEYLAHIHDFELIIPELFVNRQRIEKMNRINLREVLKKTVQKSRIEISDELFGDDHEEKKDMFDVIIETLDYQKQGVELSDFQLFLDKLWREDQKRKREEGLERETKFDSLLLKRVPKFEGILSEFLDEQLMEHGKMISEHLGNMKKGLSLEILFAFITDEGTKKILTFQEFKDWIGIRMPEIPDGQLEMIIEAYKKLKLLRVLPS